MHEFDNLFSGKTTVLAKWWWSELAIMTLYLLTGFASHTVYGNLLCLCLCLCVVDEWDSQHGSSDGRPTVVSNDRLFHQSRRSRGRRDVTGYVPCWRRRRATGALHHCTIHHSFSLPVETTCSLYAASYPRTCRRWGIYHVQDQCVSPDACPKEWA